MSELKIQKPIEKTCPAKKFPNYKCPKDEIKKIKNISSAEEIRNMLFEFSKNLPDELDEKCKFHCLKQFYRLAGKAKRNLNPWSAGGIMDDIGGILLSLGMPKEALAMYKKALHAAGKTGDAEKREWATKFLSEKIKKLEKIMKN
ncbi:hypothetical protein KAW38_03910 [Candidatus Micrarchaeota archaeon]|nr:hypothetical protein [Candidatus Micrarchaeota archaeon]